MNGIEIVNTNLGFSILKRHIQGWLSFRIDCVLNGTNSVGNVHAGICSWHNMQSSYTQRI